jgi:amino acid transporter
MVAGVRSSRRLPATLRFRHLVVFGLTFMVPTAPFGVFGSVFAVSGGQIVAAYVIGAAVMGLTAVSFVVLSGEFAGTGSVHTYVGHGVGPVSGFLAGWMLLLDYLLVPGLICVLGANALHVVLPAVPAVAWVVVITVVTTALNLLGIRQTVRASTVMLVVQMAVLVAFVAAGIGHLATDPPAAPLAPLGGSGSPQALFAGVAVAVLSYLGFEAIGTLGEESTGHRRLVGWAIAAALALCAVLFVAQSWLAALLLPDPAGLIASGDSQGVAFYTAIAVAGGAWLAQAAAICVAAAGLANSLVAQAVTARLLLSFAREGQAPAVLGRVGRAPVAASLVVAVLTLAVALTATATDGLSVLVTLVNVGALAAFAALHVAAFVHVVVRGGSRRLVHVLVPPVGALAIAGVVVSAADVARGLGAAWLLAGVVIAAVWVWPPQRARGRGLPADR